MASRLLSCFFILSTPCLTVRPFDADLPGAWTHRPRRCGRCTGTGTRSKIDIGARGELPGFPYSVSIFRFPFPCERSTELMSVRCIWVYSRLLVSPLLSPIPPPPPLQSFSPTLFSLHSLSCSPLTYCTMAALLRLSFFTLLGRVVAQNTATLVTVAAAGSPQVTYSLNDAVTR